MSAFPKDNVLPENLQDYPDGSLLRVVFHDFLIYQHTAFVPSEKLNIILGHNGSGKSSIICGICLACGGSPKSLGRSESTADYIRHGCIDGYVEVAIADKEKGPQVVRVTIKKRKPLEYRINDIVVQQSEVECLRKRYNIQIDNPCAFLAQDKVKSFSEQSPVELLKNTMKASSPLMLGNYQKLLQQRTESIDIAEKCTSSKELVQDFEEELHKIKPLVEDYKKKIALRTRLHLLEKLKIWLEFEQAEEELKKEKTKVKIALEAYEEEVKKVEKYEKEKKETEERLKIEKKKIEKLQNAADEILTKTQSESDKHFIEKIMGEATAKLEGIKNDAKEHKQKIRETKNLLKVAEKKLKEANEELSGYSAFLVKSKAAEKKFTEELAEHRIEEDAIQKKKYELKRMENKNQATDNTADKNIAQRLTALSQISIDAAKAYNFYLKNKKDFKGPVYVPIMNIVLKSNRAVMLLENSISPRDQVIFVCSHKEDEQKLQSNDKFRISSTVIPNEKIHREEIHAVISDDLKKLGFRYLITEAVDAPPPLKQYFCNVSRLNRIPFGDLDEKRLDEITKHLEKQNFEVFMSPETRFQIKRSEYSGETIQIQGAMRVTKAWHNPCYLVSPNPKNKMDDESSKIVQKLKAEIESQTKTLEKKRRETEKGRYENRQAGSDWKTKKLIQTKWNADVILHKNELQNLENEIFDVGAAETEYENVKKTVVVKTKEMLDKCQERLKEAVQKYREIGQCSIIIKICQQKLEKLPLEIGSSVIEYQIRKDDAEEQLKAALTKVEVARTNLQNECQFSTFNEEEMSESDNERFNNMVNEFVRAGCPSKLEDTENAITNEATQLKMAEENGQGGTEDHVRQMRRLELDLAYEQTNNEKLVKHRDTLYETLNESVNAWKVEAEKMIEEINNNYIQFFEALNCRGEVSLDIPENPLDIEKYGIMLMVSFRKGERLKRLDNKVQSGGERSVATMLYLLALQQLCPVPFRCIDEINQGMDPTNERKVFDIMVGLWNGTCGTLAKTQYFLLSPKLLHGLNMGENVNVVLVNSTLSKEHSQFYDTKSKLDATFARLGIDA